MSLFNKYRPKLLSEIVGQTIAVQTIQKKLDEGTWPSTSLFSGPTGTGKTTLALIVADLLTGGKANPIEVNCAEVRGIDSVREMQEQLEYPPLVGGKVVYILDEVVQLPKATQQAALSLLERPPEWAYFLLCTSDMSGLLPTFLGRCFKIPLGPIPINALHFVVQSICIKEKRSIFLEVANEITSRANGSARNALQLLEAVLAQPDDQAQLESVRGAGEDGEDNNSIGFLGKLLLQNSDWRSVCVALKKVKSTDDAERMRWSVMIFLNAVLCNGNNETAYRILRSFRNSFKDSGVPGLTAACYEVTFRIADRV